MKNHKLAPSILAADFSNLKSDFDLLNKSEADWVHIDIMDGHFVPNISFGPAITSVMASMSKLPLDIHLMIDNPEEYVDQFIALKPEVITFHIEATDHAHRLLTYIRSKGIKAGIAINPQTSVDALDDVLEELDLVCIMSVNPGFGGQKFIYRTLHKVKALSDKIITRNLDVLIEIDGGVGLQNAEALLKAGADVLVAGSSVFKSDDPLKTINRFKSIEIGNFDLT